MSACASRLGRRYVSRGIVPLAFAFAPVAASAAPQAFQYEFNACVVRQDATFDIANTGTGQMSGLRRLILVNHGPGSTEQELQIGFVTNPQTTDVGVQSSGAYGSGVRFYYLQVPESEFDWLLGLVAKYKTVHVAYSYQIDQGQDSLQHVTVGAVPPSVPVHCS